MKREQIIGLILIFIIIFGSTWYMQPSKEELAEQKRVQDSIADVRETNRLRAVESQIKRDSVRKTVETAVVVSEEVTDAKLKNKWGEFASSAQGENKEFLIDNDLLKIKFNNKGGRIASVELKDFQTYDSLPLVLFDEESSEFSMSFFYENRVINTSELFFVPFVNGSPLTHASKHSVSGDESLTFSLRLYLDQAINPAERYIEFEYILKGDSYMLDYNMNLVGIDDIINNNSNGFNLNWNAEIQSQEKSIDDERKVTSVFYKHYEDEVESLNETKDSDVEEIKTRIKWVGFKQKFFTSVLVADRFFDGAKVETLVDETHIDEPRYIKTTGASIEIPIDRDNRDNIAMHFYFGPTKYNILKSFDFAFEEMIPLGWWIFKIINKYAVILVFNWLETTGLNYGIIILILTVMLKLFLLPIAYKTYMSSAKMRVLKPEIDEIGKKFPNKDDAMKKQQATMSLYKKAGVNPLAGCVPMLLQMPILIAMFRFFPASIELRQQSFLWAEDLSTYDSIWTFPNGFEIPWYGDHVSLFTLLMTISTVIYTKVNSELMGSTNNQMPGMKTMMYLMPLMFLGFLNNYASGLSYYYFLANIITFAQMYLIKSFVNEDKLRIKIQANKKKPVKKSAWASRIEEAAKTRGIQQKKK